jgi:hypothetical protein
MQLKHLFETTTEEGARETLKEALELVSYAKYIDENGNKKYFAIDNYFDEERVKSYYQRPENLKHAYEKTKYFDVNYQHKNYPLSDGDRLKIRKAESRKDKRLAIIEQLNLLNGESGGYDEPLFREFRDSLHREDSLIVEAYEILGEAYAKQNLMSDKKMQLDLIKHKSETGKDKFAIMSSIYAVFSEGNRYDVSYIKRKIRNIYSSYGDNTSYPTAKIKDYFTVNDNVKLKGKRAYLLISKRV